MIKTIAEAMGLKLECDVITGYYRDVETIEYPWNPETDWSDTGRVLNWLISKLGKKDAWELVKQKWIYGIDVHKIDFQTAVCMAAFELAKTKNT